MGPDDQSGSENQGSRNDELIADITPDVMRVLESCRFFEELDDRLCPLDAAKERDKCHGDFQISSIIPRSHGFVNEELAEILSVFQSQGGFCDCEVLYNVVEVNRLKARYWRARAEGRRLPVKHTSGT